MIKKDRKIENIRNFHTVDWEPEVLWSFLSCLFKDLRNKCGTRNLSLYSFREFLCMPMIITERLFSILNTSRTGHLTKMEFAKGLSCLYLGSIEDQIKLVFRLFDCNSDEMITLDDITLLLSHFHMISQTFDKISSVEKIIQNSLFPVSALDLKAFSEMIFKTNSDIFLLTQIFLIQYIPITSNQIQAFKHSHREKQFASYGNEKVLPELVQPSSQLIQYLGKVLYNLEESNILDDSENEINELEKFEHNVQEVFSAWKVDSSEERLKSNEAHEQITFRQYSLRSRLHSFFMKKRAKFDIILSSNAQNKDVTVCNEINCMNYTFSNKSQNYSKAEIFLCCILDSKLVKCKLSLIDDCIFYYSMSEDNTPKFKKIFSLRSTYVTKCLETLIGDQTYFPFQLVSRYNMNQVTITFLSTYQEEIRSFIHSIKRNIYYRRIQDYYNIDATIVKGNGLEMKLGTKKSTRQQVLIKIISKSANEESSKLLVWEKDVFCFLQNISHHAGLIKPMEKFEILEKVFFVYECISEGDLITYLKAREDSLAPLEVINYSTEILNSVELLNKFESGMKKENVDNNKEKVVKLINNDLSKSLEKETHIGSYRTVCDSFPDNFFKNLFSEHRGNQWNAGVIINLLAFGLFRNFRVAPGKNKEGIVNDLLFTPSSITSTEQFEKILRLIKACHLRQ